MQVQLLSDARKQLDPVDKMIDDARWDAIRTIIKTSPLSDMKVREGTSLRVLVALSYMVFIFDQVKQSLCRSSTTAVESMDQAEVGATEARQ